VHHGGLLPIIKEMVEMLFARGLVKVCARTLHEYHVRCTRVQLCVGLSRTHVSDACLRLMPELCLLRLLPSSHACV